MRILHVIPTYVPAWRYGGPIVAVHGLCRALVRRGHDVHVFTTSVDGPGDLDVPLGVPVDVDGVSVRYFVSQHLRRLYWSPSLGVALKARLPDYDLVHLHSVFLWPTWAAARAARRMGKPYVLSPRGMLVRELIARRSRVPKELWIRFVERRTLEKAAAIHATSILEQQELVRFGFQLPQVAVIPNGVDQSPGSQEDPAVVPLQVSNPFLLYLGRISWKKGLDRLISAMTFVPDVNLVVVGNDDENYRPQLEALAEKLGVRCRIHFVGPVYGAQKQALLQRAAVLVLPSYSENFGNVVLEAMAAGCPVAVTEEVGAAAIVQASGAGIVSAGDPVVLGQNLRRMLASPAMLQRMGNEGRQTVAARYSWESVAVQMESLYQNIIRGNNKP